jgi:HSP20 family protein
MFSGTWIPPVDISEEGDRLMVRAEVPGVKKDDIQIEFNEGVLTLRGERKFEKTSDEPNFHRVERTYGTFTRSFSLPRTVDAEKIAARYEDGVLEISIPKREEAKPRQIRIDVAKNEEKS